MQRYCSIVWLRCSVCPSSSGWSPEVKWIFISKAVPREQKKWEMNLEPWILVLPWLSQCFCQKMGTVFQIKFLKSWRYSRVWKGPKAEGHVSALMNYIIRSWVIQVAFIWLIAWLQIKAMWITQEWMIKFLSAKTCPSAFGPLHTMEYLQNNGNFIWNTVSIFWKNLGWAMATLM